MKKILHDNVSVCVLCQWSVLLPVSDTDLWYNPTGLDTPSTFSCYTEKVESGKK